MLFAEGKAKFKSLLIGFQEHLEKLVLSIFHLL